MLVAIDVILAITDDVRNGCHNMGILETGVTVIVLPQTTHTLGLLAPHNRIVGRGRQIRAAINLLDQPEVRLFTLTGPGGVGKTRLAVEVASSWTAQSRVDLATLSLAPLRDAGLVLPTVAATLAVGGDDSADLHDRIAAHIDGKPLLLLLDNMEHLLAAAPDLEGLLVACPGLKLLVTSRTPLHISGEQVLDVPPLAFPDPTHLPSLHELARTEAVTLFVQRARVHDPEFELTADNAPSVAAICAHLDGLPLAIELAAGRLQVLSPTSLLERLTHRLDLLTRGSQKFAERHQSLRSTIAWSYNQLQPVERIVFQRLAVFDGGCDLAAAEHVVDGKPNTSSLVPEPQRHRDVNTLDAIAELIDNALLRREVIAGEPRFMMLETIREYALEQLESSGDATETRNRHAEYFAALAEEAEPALSVGLVRGHWPDRLEREHANLRAALAWSLDQPDPDVGLRLAAALVWFWWIRGHLVEGSAWLECALLRSRDDQSALRSKLLDGAGKLARTRGDFNRAGELHEASLRIASCLEDDIPMARALANLALVAEATGQTERATELFDRALGLARVSGQRELLATLLTNYGLMKLTNEDQRRGVGLLEEGLILARDLGPSGFLGAILSNLGDARLEQGDREAAASMYRECLELQAELGNKRGIADALVGIGAIGLHRGELRFAARLLASAQALYESINATPPPQAVRQFDHALHSVGSGLDAATLATIWESGRNADLATVIAEALELTSRSSSGAVASVPSGQAITGLTSRELDVLRLLAQGYSNRAIADALYISPLTSATHVKRIRAKIGVSTRTAAAAYAHLHGLI